MNCSDDDGEFGIADGASNHWLSQLQGVYIETAVAHAPLTANVVTEYGNTR